jgi:PAS domain S-box-containing protein
MAAAGDDEDDDRERRRLRTAVLQNAEQELLAAREALREREERLGAIFNQAAVGMAVATLDGRFEEVNERFVQILGYPLEELRKLSFTDLTHPDDLPATQANVRRLLAGEVTDYVNEKRFVHKDGSHVWTLTSVTLLRDPAGEPRRFVGVVEDITERRRAEEALRARERELSLIYGNVSDVIFYVSAEPGGRYRFVSVNPAFLAVTGLTEEQVVGRLVDEVIPEPSRSLVLDNYATAIRERRTVRWEEATLFPAGEKVGLVSVTPVFDAVGDCINLIGTVHDITDRKREEEARARLAAIVESSDDAIVSKTLEGIIMTWNAGAERTFGYTADEVIGKSITILMPPDRVNEEPGSSGAA